MTLAEKILAAHSGKKRVSPGEFISARVDLVMANDITAPIAIMEFERLGIKAVFDPQRVVMVTDHNVPAKDILAAEQAKLLRDFARQQGLVYLDCGKFGIEHVVLPEQGLVHRLCYGHWRDMDEGSSHYKVRLSRQGEKMGHC
jgi:3-isopropylmalate/(R)-2-methylmalate dehydratase large subunit